MLPVVALIGRPNVGKSTLFNALTNTKQALVVDTPGVTRDRQYGLSAIEEKNFIVIDTGGITKSDTELDKLLANQSKLAIEEACVVFWVVDAKIGITQDELELATYLRKLAKKIVIVANKADGDKDEIAAQDFYQLGFKEVVAIAAKNKKNLYALLDFIPEQAPLTVSTEDRIKIALVGRPNVGKSTLVNKVLGEERVIVMDLPGTTRDSIYIDFNRGAHNYTIIDTAGVRKKARVKETVEKFSVVKTLQAIKDAHVVLLVIEANAGVTDQDLSLISFILEAGKSLLLLVNKSDLLTNTEQAKLAKVLQYRLEFADFIPHYFISATKGAKLASIFQAINKAHRSQQVTMSSQKLTTLLSKLLERHATPMVNGRRIKLRYAHLGGQCPPRIVIHGKQTEKLPASYKKYLTKGFQQELKLFATPLWLNFKTDSNPFVS